MKLSLRTCLITLALASGSAWAQVPPIITTSQPYVPLATGTPVTFIERSGTLVDTDEGSAVVTLPFSFPYFGTSYTSVALDTNGYITFGGACTSGCYTNTSFPTAGLPNAVIAGFWEDMDVGAGSVRTQATASEFVIEYSNVEYWLNSASKVTFQIKLTASGSFSIHLGPMVDSGNSFTGSVGFENQAGTLGANLLSGCTTGCKTVNWVPNQLFTIGEPNQADLVVSSVSLTNFTENMGNLTFTVNSTLRNLGRTAAPPFMWKAFLSRDLVLDTTATDGGADIEVAQGGPESLPAVDGGVTADGGLAIVNVTANAATTTPPPTGEYYVLVQVDSNNDVQNEASEANNVGSTTTAFVQGVDIVATSISGPATTGGGNTENFAFSFTNRGTLGASVPYRIMLSADQTLDATDYVVSNGTYNVSINQTITETALPVVMPAGVPSGQFYFLLVINPDGASALQEASYSNNVAVSSARVDVRRADLLIESVNFLDTVTGLDTAAARFGEATQMRIRFRNTGGANATNFRVAMVLSSDSSLSLLSDSYVCDQTVALVVPSTTSTEVVLNCTLPLRNAAMVSFRTGQYYLFGLVDATGAVFESNDQNNILMVGPVRITEPGPDLTVTSVTAPASAGVGEIIPVVRTIKNIGNVNSPAVAYRYFASANDIITTDDVPLKIVDGSTGNLKDEGMITLTAGQGDTQTELVRLPGTMPAGTYYVGCIVDPTATVTNDLQPTNNALASRSMVVAPSSLRVVNTALPDAVIGRPYSFRLSATGEQGTSTWRIEPSLGGAPSWLSIGATDGLLTGTPTGSGGAEVVGVTVILENSGRQAAVRLALRVLPTTSGVEVTTSTLPAVVNSTASQYQYSLGAAGGVKPYNWRLAGGTLPQGLALGTDGVLFGAPRNASNGAIPITVEVRDAVGGRATRQLSLRLIAPGAITFRTVAIPDALIGQEYLQDIAVANQDGSMLAKPLIWRVTGAVPGGLNVTPQAELITVAGRPTQAGTFSFSISVEDNNGRSDTLEFTMTVHPPRYRVTASLPEVLRPGTDVSIPLSVSPTGTVQYSVVNGTLPPGLSLDPAGTIGGTVAADGSEGLWSFVIEAKDAAGMTGLSPMSLRVEREARALGCSSSGTADFSPLALMAIAGAVMMRSKRRRVSGAALGLTAALALFPLAARAQVYNVVGPTPVSYQPLANGAVTTAGAAITVPFAMPFFDTTFTSVAMSQYGYLAIGGQPSNYSTNQNVPHSSTSTTIPRTYIAPWWDVLTAPQSATNGYRYQVTGVAPNRVMAFEWNAVGANAAATRISFQVQLFETTGRIRFVYSTALPGVVSASVGIQKDVSVGFPGLTCASSATCTSTAYPAGQAIDFFLPPDFEIVSLSAPQVGYAGVAFPQSATVRNRGGRDATNVYVRYWLSTDATLDRLTDTVIGSTPMPGISVDAQGTAQSPINAPLPANLSQSTYFLFACADPDNAIPEQSDLNNCSAPVQISIGAPTPDLVVAGFSAPTAAMPGASLTVSRSLQNLGNANSVAAKYTYFLSDNASVSIADRSLSVGNLGVLNPQQVDMAMDTITIPAELPPGAYWLGVCVNYDASTSTFGGNEITIVNNCFTQAAAVQVSTGTVAISTAALPPATRYAPFGLRLQATGGTGVYVWELAGGTLPAGLTLSSTGDLVGSPSVAGTFSFDAKVTSGTLTDTRSLSLTVMPGGLPLVIVDQSLTAAEFGRVYTASLVAVGGTPPYTWRALAADDLPPGLAVATDGLLEGRPVAAGDFTFAVEVKDSTGAAVSKELALRVVTPTSLSIATSALETALVGRDYLQPLVAVGGTAPYSWTLIRFQELPENITDAPGAVLFDNGMKVDFPPDFGIGIDDRDTADYLSGTPRKAGLYAITLKVKDGADTEDTASVLLRVSYRDGLAITTLQLPDAFVNQPYQVRLSHNGGSDAVGIAFSLPCIQQAVRPGEFACAPADATQKLPGGLELKADGTIIGTATGETGTYTFLVKVVDGLGRQDVRALALRLRPDFALDKSGCSAVGMDPSLLALGLAAFALRRRRSR